MVCQISNCTDRSANRYARNKCHCSGNGFILAPQRVSRLTKRSWRLALRAAFLATASVYLAQACDNGKVFEEITITIRKNTDGAQLDYLVMTMEGVVISSCDFNSDFEDPENALLIQDIALDFQRVTLKYAQQSVNGAASTEHEVTLSAKWRLQTCTPLPSGWLSLREREKNHPSLAALFCLARVSR